jgi:hypothetical protein
LRFKFRKGERVPPRAQQIAPRDLHLKDLNLPLLPDLFPRLCVRREGAPNGSRGGCGPHQNLQPNATVKKRRGRAEESGTTEGLIPVTSAIFAILAVQISEGERVPPRVQQIAPRDLHLKDVKLPLPLDSFPRLCVRREGAPNGSRGGCGPHQNL